MYPFYDYTGTSIPSRFDFDRIHCVQQFLHSARCILARAQSGRYLSGVVPPFAGYQFRDHWSGVPAKAVVPTKTGMCTASPTTINTIR